MWDDFAVAALQGRLAGEARRDGVTEVIDYMSLAVDVWNIADAMLAERKARVGK